MTKILVSLLTYKLFQFSFFFFFFFAPKQLTIPFRKNETKRFRRLTVKSILHPVETGARPTGSTRRKTRRVSNKKFNGPASKWRLEPILEPSIKRYYTEGRNFSRSVVEGCSSTTFLLPFLGAYTRVQKRLHSQDAVPPRHVIRILR